MAKIPDIPSIEDVPQDGPLAWLKNWLATVRLWAQLRDPRMTLVGDPLDKFTDRRELVQLGLIQRGTDGTFYGGPGYGSGTTIVNPGGGGGGGAADVPDLAAPPAPTGLAVVAGIFQVNLSWTAPSYTTRGGTKTNSKTIIYGAVWATGAAEPTFSDVRTKRIDTAEGASTLHSFPSPAATRWAIWIAFESYDGVEGPPGGGVNGQQGTTGQDVTALLTILTGQIRESQLFSTLGTRVNLIDASSGTAGSVNARIATETTNRGLALTALSAVKSRTFYGATTPASDVNYTLQTNDVWINTADSNKPYRYNGSGWDAVPDARVGTAVTDISNEVTNRTNADNAEIAVRESLYAGLGAAVGTDYKVFNQSGTPTGTTIGDVWTWKISGGAETFSRWNGTAWVNSLSDKRAAIYRGEYANDAALPSSGNVIGDLARRTTPSAVMVWNGSAWAAKTNTPSPIYAFVESEKASRVAGDSAEASARDTLAVQLRGAYTGTDLALVSAGLVYSEREARVTAVGAQATRTDVLEARTNNGNAAPFTALLGWDMNGSAGGWAGYPGYSGSLTPAATYLAAVANGAGDLILARDLLATEQFLGANTDKIRVRLKRSGSAYWTGVVYYSTTGHGEDGGFYKQITEPVWASDGWAVAEWDMAALSAGGSDWVTSTITRVRFDLQRNAAAGAGYDIDWISFGSRAGTSLYAAVNTEVTTRTSLTTAQAGSITTLQSKVNSPSSDPGNAAYNVTYAGLVTEQSTRASLDGSVQLLHTVRAEVSAGGRTVVGGFGLAGTATATQGPRIDFGVRADTFFVEAPGGGGNPTSKLTPFTIRTSATYDGPVLLPAGVYMDAAFIVDLTAQYARIATLVADDITSASINVSQLVAGTLNVGAYAQSSDYPGGVNGWRISGNGNADFRNVTARGTIIATAGSIGGNTIDTTGMQSPGYSSGSSGWRISSLGFAEFNGVTVRGAVFASSGTFAGSLSGATGTYSGSVTVGSSPAVSGTTMTGTGAVFNSNGTFSIGKPSQNITYNGSDLTINGAVIVTGNIVNDAITPVRYVVEMNATEKIAGSSSTWRDVISLTITTTGKPVMLTMYTESAVEPEPDWRFMRDSTIFATDNDNRRPTPFHIVDAPSAGTYTYKIQTKGYPTVTTQRSVIHALELRNSN